MRSIRGRSCNSIAGLVFRVPVTCAPISHIHLYTYPPRTPFPPHQLTALSPSQPHRQVIDRNEEEKKIGIYSHQAPNAHDRPHAGNSVFPTHLSSAFHPTQLHSHLSLLILLLLRSNKGQKKDRKPTGSVMILTPSHSLHHAHRQHHR